MLALGTECWEQVLPICSFRIIRQLPKGRTLAASQYTVSRNTTSMGSHRCPPSALHLLTDPHVYVGVVKPEHNLNHLLTSPNCQPCAGRFCLYNLKLTNFLTSKA